MRRVPRSMGLVAVGAAVNSFGMGFFWPLTAVYVHRALGEPMAIAGAVLTVQAAAGLLGSAVGGLAFDRYGARPPLLASAAASVAVLVWLALAPSFWVYAATATVLGLDVGLVFPVLNALAPQVWPQGGRDAFNVVYVAFNVGVALGPVAAGLVAGVSYRLTFLCAAALLGGLWALVWLGYRGPGFDAVGGGARAARERTGLAALSAVGPATLLLAAGLALDWTGYAQWLTTTPNFMQAFGLPLPLYSLLWTVNGVLIVFGQPLLARVVGRLPRVKSQILAGNLLFAGCFLLLALGRAYAVDLAAMVLSTFAEMLVWPAVPAAADAATPPERRGAAQGVVTMAGFVGRMVGPLVGGLLYGAGPGVLFLAMVVAVGAAEGVYAVHDRTGRAAMPARAGGI